MASPFEAQLERMRLFARPKRCPKCKGDGFTPLSPKRWVQTTELEREQQRWLGQKPRYLVSPRSRGVSLEHSGTCRRCGGVGWIEASHRPRKGRPLTVRTRCVRGRDRWGSVPLGTGGVTLTGEDVVAIARVERRLGWVEAEEPVLRAVLCRYYDQSGGKLRAIWELVPAGRTLLRRNEVEALNPLLFFENVIRRQSEVYDSQIGALLNSADEQARELLDRACRVWNEAPREQNRNQRASLGGAS